MYDEHGKQLTEVTPGMPVQVLGWKSFPLAGDIILQADSEKHARDVVQFREQKLMEEKMLGDQVIIEKKAQMHYEKYRKERQERLMKGRYRKMKNYFREKEVMEDTHPFLSFVLKGDVHGSVEAIMDVVNTYDSHDACRLDVIHSGVGNVTENDVELAETFDGIIYTFNVKVPPEIKKLADEKGIQIKPFNVIYHLIADMKTEISSRLPLVEEEDVLGLISSLRHEKSDVETIKKDVECGLMVADTEISFEPGDIIICYDPKSVAQETDWNPGF
ncbi:unnamed protein product [Larinioides sclopetarius]